ncbi:MAG: AAA family ATPase [Acidimicrobiia bacterium]|nr:AAA family ATPase [Acidimicrobiia bacterium]
MLDRRLIIVSGKGGVGKSAVSVALAIRAQRTGKRVLVAAMLEPTGAAIHLGADTLAYLPTHFDNGVDAMVVERAAALEEYLRVQLRVPAVGPTKTLSRAMQVLVDTAPGVREVISMGKPIFDTWQGQYDTVIVDAPPLGQLMSYLRAPAVVAGLVPTGGIKEQAGRMADALADVDTSALVLVTTPEELPATETAQALDELRTENLIELGAVMANRVIPPLDLDRTSVAGLGDGPGRDAVLHHLALWESQQAALNPLPVDIELPYLFGVHTPSEVAAQLADCLEDAK